MFLWTIKGANKETKTKRPKGDGSETNGKERGTHTVFNGLYLTPWTDFWTRRGTPILLFSYIMALTTPPGPIFKAQLLHSKMSENPEMGGD